MQADRPTEPFLTKEQVYALNERHGWFEYGDAQSDKSRAFAQDAIAMHERIRSSAQELLAALIECTEHLEWSTEQGGVAYRNALAIIVKATGRRS